MQIDHDPEEPKVDRGPGPWKSVFVILILGWAWFLYFRPFDWPAIALGIGTGGGIVAWAIEITGNKIPDSWRSKSRNSGRS